MTAAVVLTREGGVARALAQVRTPTWYKLGAGGADAAAPSCADSSGRADCSAFAMWACGYARNAGDWNTDRILGDVWVTDLITGKIKRPGKRQRFDAVAVGDSVLPGDLIVYGGTFARVGDKLKRTRPGHVGVIVEVLPGFVRGQITRPGWWTQLRVAHCSPSNRKRHGNAVAIDDASIWKLRGYIVRPRQWAAPGTSTQLPLPGVR